MLLLYYSLSPSLPPPPSLFILARGERRDDNGKSKGFQEGGKAKRAGEETRGAEAVETRERGRGGWKK